MPGVLQIEAMAQAAGILMLRKISTEGKTALFMSCDKAKFRRAVRPGDQLVISVEDDQESRQQDRRGRSELRGEWTSRFVG
jgi:3-hydroxymyristoyl/3-hydroxydecanoyl-(acyl carrier protein) dehydratase